MKLWQYLDTLQPCTQRCVASLKISWGSQEDWQLSDPTACVVKLGRRGHSRQAASPYGGGAVPMGHGTGALDHPAA